MTFIENKFLKDFRNAEVERKIKKEIERKKGIQK